MGKIPGAQKSLEPKVPEAPSGHRGAAAYRKLKGWLEAGGAEEYVFSELQSPAQRAIVHEMAEKFNLWHRTAVVGKERHKTVVVRKKKSPEELAKERRTNVRRFRKNDPKGEAGSEHGKKKGDAREGGKHDAATSAATAAHSTAEDDADAALCDKVVRSNVRSQQRSSRFVPDPPEDEESLEYYLCLKSLAEDDHNIAMDFPSELTSTQRHKVHSQAERFYMKHFSIGSRSHRFIRVEQQEAAEVNLIRAQEEHLQEVLDQHHANIQRSQAEAAEAAKASAAAAGACSSGDVAGDGLPCALSVPGSVQCTPSVPSGRRERAEMCREPAVNNLHGNVRFCNWNIEWMDHFFEDDTKMRTTYPEGELKDVDALCKAIASTIDTINPDVLAIEEGPSTIERMQLYVRLYLGDRFECFGGDDGMEQKIFILVRKGGPVNNARTFPEADEYLSREWTYDISGDFVLKPYKFTRRPTIIQAEVATESGVQPIFFVALHTKSKFIHGGERMWNSRYIGDKLQFIKKATRNRRRIAAECARTRKCLDDLIWSKHSNPLVWVSGDLNDGPGNDFFEEYYLLFDSVGLLMGNPFLGTNMLNPILIRSSLVPPEEQYTVTFHDYVDERLRDVLLDHIFASHSLAAGVKRASIGHSFVREYEREQRARLTEDEREEIKSRKWAPPRQLRLSDHAPVWCEFL
eukprot:TRINITY_DN7549_c0_g1_i1.p1 TRINITY_DN7549_c0_g1~~TRINITY_DN7549_c0_g1_i1.p1  ORF type:complete len:707 (+),score=257.16 TRINITY_DN7549_c0_g1_i1:56-2122(+)